MLAIFLVISTIWSGSIVVLDGFSKRAVRAPNLLWFAVSVAGLASQQGWIH